MDHGDGVTQTLGGTAVPQELLEEMLWVFRVEDCKWWGTGVWSVCALNTNSGLWLKPPSIWSPHTRPPLTRQAAHFLQDRV